jgi:hypothetical protein
VYGLLRRRAQGEPAQGEPAQAVPPDDPATPRHPGDTRDHSRGGGAGVTVE